MAKLTDLWVNIGAKTDKLDRGLKDAEGKISRFNSTITRLGGVIAGAFAISKITAFASESIKLAAITGEVAVGFERLQGVTLSELRKAVSGTVDDLTLMKAAVRADSLGIPIKQLATYFEFAERKAGELGVSTEQAVEALVNGIGAKSTRAMKMLGISAIELNKKFGEIEPTMLSVGEVSGKVFEIVNEQLGVMGENTESAADKIDQMNASWKNVKVTIGEILMPVVSKFVSLMNQAVTGWQNILNPQKLTGELATDEINRISKSLQGLSQQDALKVLQKELRDIQIASASLSNQKFFIFGNKLKNANQELNAYSKISYWLKQVFYDVKALNSLTTPPIIEGKKLGAKGFKAPKNTLQTMEGIGPSLLSNDIVEEYKNRGLVIVDTNKKIEDSANAVDESFAQFTDSLKSLGAEAENFEDFAKAAVNAARQFVAAKLAEVVAQQIQNAIKSSGGNPYVALAVGAAVGGATAAMFNSIVPKLAEGGIATKPTLAMIGEKGPEGIIPLNKMKNMGVTRVTGDLHLRGKDLYWSLKNYNDYLSKTT